MVAFAQLRPWQRFALPALAAAGLACGDSTGTAVMGPASLTLIPSKVTLDAIGATQQLEPTIRDALGNTLSGIDVNYQSSDVDVATVSSAGVVTAVKIGTVQITATADSLSRTTEVIVRPLPATLQKVSGDQQSAVVTQSLGAPFVLQVNDRLDNPVEGAVVQYTLSGGLGTLDASSVTTVADGRASVTLTLDTLAGAVYQVTAAATTGSANPLVFAASGVADAPDQGAVADGDMQRQPAGTLLPRPLVVKVTDRFANGVSGHPVTFTVTGGGGSVNPTMATTDSLGEARTNWTLGSTIGPQSVQADLGALTGSPVGFAGVGTDLAVLSIVPDTLVEGLGATITGTGFDAVIANDTVLIDGRMATITAATSTTLDFIVPMGACKPAQDIDVVVSTAMGGTTPPTPHPAAPDQFVSLAVGEHMVLQDPTDVCFQFDQAAGAEEYLLGVQSTTDISQVTVVRLIGETAGAAPAPPIAGFGAPRLSFGGSAAPLQTPRAQRWRAHREAEVALRLTERQVLAGRPVRAAPGMQSRTQAFIDSTVQVGQTVSIRIPNIAGNLCTESTLLSVQVKAVGARGIWLHDPNNDPNGFTDQDYQDLSDDLDAFIFDSDTAYFGAPTDLDNNGRVLILVSQELNQASANTLGFVSLVDLITTPSTCPATNEAEIYYQRAPDPTGATGFVYTRIDALNDAPSLIAHEFAHIIQAGRRLVINQTGNFMTIFEAEGQATLAEEVAGHADLGNMPGQNYGFNVGFNSSPRDWYAVGLNDIAFYFGNNPISPDISVNGAPEECTWISSNPSPCGGRALWYGVTWSFLRWINDQFGSSFAGGEQEIQKLLVDNTLLGFDNIANVLGVPIGDLLAEWAAALYVDDRVVGANPRLTIPSWNYFDVFETGLPASASLTPGTLAFADLDGTIDVAAASTAYFLLQGASRPAIAFRVRDVLDGDLPAHIQAFLVRTQ